MAQARPMGPEGGRREAAGEASWNARASPERVIVRLPSAACCLSVPAQFDDLVRLDEIARVVGGEDDETILAFGRDGPLDDRTAVGVEPDHGLVQEQCRRIEEKSECDLQPLLHARRKGAHALAQGARQSDLRQAPRHVFGAARPASRAREEEQVLEGREVLVERQVGPRPAHGQAARVAGELLLALSDRDGSGARLREGAENLQERRLAAPVSALDREKSRLGAEGETGEERRTRKCLRELPGLDRRREHAGTLARRSALARYLRPPGAPADSSAKGPRPSA